MTTTEDLLIELTKLIKQLQLSKEMPGFKLKEPNPELKKAVEKLKMDVADGIGFGAFMKCATDIKPSTAKCYWTKLKTIHYRYTGSVWDQQSFEWLRDTKAVLTFIEQHEKWGKTSKWNYIIAITSVLSRVSGFENEHTIYSAASKQKLETYSNEREKNVLNVKQTANIVPWKTVLEAKPPDTITEMLLFEMVRFIPRRSGTYRQMRWRTTDHDDQNYFLVGDDGDVVKMVLNKYKTYKTYGTFRTPVSKHLSDVISMYIHAKLVPVNGLLFPKSLQNQGRFSAVLTNTMAKLFDGRRMGTTLCRISYASYMIKLNPSVAEQKKIGLMLGHSDQQLRLYAKLDIPDLTQSPEESQV